MYKYLLCWRYLRTRYIALASIISVMLGVATMIVVNAVMTGFACEMEDRMHGILSDIVFESRSLEGAPDAELRMEEIDRIAGQYIDGMTPTVVVPAMLGYSVLGQYVTKQVNLIGIDEKTYAQVSDFGKYLQHPENRRQLDFELKEGGYDVYDHQAADSSKTQPRTQMEQAGWELRRMKAALSRPVEVDEEELEADPFRLHRVATQTAAPAELDMAENPHDPSAPVGKDFDPSREQHIGCVLGMALCTYRKTDGTEQFLALPGDDVELTYPSSGRPPRPLHAKFTITDFYESKMQEFDAGFVFVPIRELQQLRNMIDPQTGVANFNTIQIRLKAGVDLNLVRDLLREKFPPEMYAINTWRDKQGPLLAAVQLETIILNILLFLIILVAGFGILATFFMIVVEKTRDIGVLKSLGASASGVLGIFVGYGVSLGTFGAGVGVVMGLLFVHYIDLIADGVSYVTGQPVFDPAIYSFHRIPVIVEPFTVSWIVLGAILIAVVASILPAWRAARLHPVKALRYE